MQDFGCTGLRTCSFQKWRLYVHQDNFFFRAGVRSGTVQGSSVQVKKFGLVVLAS